MKMPIAKPSARTLFGVGAAALLLALAGTGGAVAGSVVTGKQIKDNTVTSADIKNSTITSTDVKDKTLTTADLAPATVTALTGKAGPAGKVGPAGPAGATGAAGPAGAPGANGMTDIAVRQTFFEPSDTGGTIQAFCHADERAVTAAFKVDGEDGGVPVVTESFPIRVDGEPVLDTIQLGSGWQMELTDAAGPGEGTVLGSISVVCAKDPA